MFTFEAGGPVSGRSGVKLCISLWLYVVLIYWRKVAWAIQVWLIYYPTPSATNYPGRLRPPVYCSALICHIAPICRLARIIVPGRLRRFLRAQLANCVGRQTAINRHTLEPARAMNVRTWQIMAGYTDVMWTFRILSTILDKIWCQQILVQIPSEFRRNIRPTPS